MTQKVKMTKKVKMAQKCQNDQKTSKWQKKFNKEDQNDQKVKMIKTLTSAKNIYKRWN